MNDNLGKKQQSYLNKSQLMPNYPGIFSLLPGWIKREKPQVVPFNKIDFIDLKSMKEKNFILEQYKLLSGEVNKTNDNRESLNNFWITLNGAILGAISYIKDMQIDNPNPKSLFIWVLGIFGLTLSVCWLKALSSIKNNIDIRNEMLIEMEKFLPVKIFTTAFNVSGRRHGKGSLSSAEKSIPLLFCIGYVIIAIIFLLYPNIL